MGIKNNSTRSQKTQKQQKPTGLWHRHKRLWKWLIGIVATIVLLVVAVYIAFQVSPWPSSMLIRNEFDKNSAKVAEALEKHVPAGVVSVENQQYRLNDDDAYLDVFYPKGTTTPRGTVVWVHGGAWVSGNKDNIDNYMKIVASHGYTAVSVNYSIAPEHKYPLPIQQLNDALGYLQDNADRLYIDPTKIALAGDSAGSQIVAQMATIATSPTYASEMSISSKLSAGSLKGMLLNCGAYDLALPDYNGPFGDFLHTVLWAYSGHKDFLDDPDIRHASVVNYVTKDFPPAFITAGNGDPLEAQSTELAKKLASLNVTTSTLFYAKDHQPQLPHEYQFNLDNKDGEKALAQMVDFLSQHIK
jgi:acetyl esterase/lipase